VGGLIAWIMMRSLKLRNVAIEYAGIVAVLVILAFVVSARSSQLLTLVGN
jgi:hypothetical protein